MGKPTLILITGWAHGAESVQPMADALTPDFDVQILSGTDVLKSRAIPEADFIITGSMGGILSMELLPNSCRKLVLISSTAKFCAAENYPCGTPEKVLRRMIVQLKREPEAVLNSFFENVHYPHKPFFTTEAQRHGGEKGLSDSVPSSAAGGKKNSLEDLVAGLEYLLNSDVRSIVPSIKIPVLLLHGKADRIIPYQASEWLSENLPTGKLTLFENGGHALPAHHFPEIMHSIRAFLQQV